MRFILRLLPKNLRAKLFFSHFLVALISALTLFLAIPLIAPVLFRRFVEGVTDSEELLTVTELLASVSPAFQRALVLSLLLAGAGAMIGATAVSLFVSRRITLPIRHMIGATSRISAGRYSERVPVHEDDELGALSVSFNSMAASLEDVERRRRELIVDVSHELRTPLSTLEAYIEGLQDGVVQPAPETWTLLFGEAERLRRLVDDLQQLSRAEAGQLSLSCVRVSPAAVLEQVVGRFRPHFTAKGVSLECEAARRVPDLLADPDRVVQVLTNLLSNALRYTEAGGLVVARVDVCDAEVCFSVRDTGVGLAPEHLPYVFERFYRVEKSRSREGGGSGVGLTISRVLVEAMGGWIVAESTGRGRGSTFTFSLPVFTSAGADARSSP